MRNLVRREAHQRRRGPQWLRRRGPREQASCQGEDGARPAASAGQDVHLRARNTGGEAEEAVKIVLDKTRRRREGEDEAASHDLVPMTLSQIYDNSPRIFNL